MPKPKKFGQTAKNKSILDKYKCHKRNCKIETNGKLLQAKRTVDFPIAFSSTLPLNSDTFRYLEMMRLYSQSSLAFPDRII